MIGRSLGQSLRSCAANRSLGLTACNATVARLADVCGRTSVGQVATYFAQPEPSWTADNVKALALGPGKRGRNRPGVKLGHRMSQEEGRAVNLAKRHGYLVMTQKCGVSACNKYLHFCYEDRRPYIAVNKHGDRVVVDLLPVEGLGGFHDPSRMDDIEDSLSELLQDYKVRHMQIVNKATEDQIAERVQAAAEADMDGSNEHKANDTDITAQFHLLFRKRQESIMAARDMYKVVVAADPARKSAKQLAADRLEKKAQQKLKWEKRMRRKLRELVADQKVFGRLPKGALDGFIKWDGEKKPHLPWYPAAWINKPC
mmetsp:Transcript_30161/g.62142  ORF Transcript_30161/g.62142 Transcript_30161/m.62142 type:complete len:314 (-) Transcript_30161:92-1033(-)